jgi:hypothetical protein
MCSAQKVIVNKSSTAEHLHGSNPRNVQDGTVGDTAVVDANFLKAQAERCRLLAKNTDEFTKRRLLVLAVHYEKRVEAAEPLAAAQIFNTPLNIERF